MNAANKALVLFSGGQDSTACLAYALDKFDHVETLGFDYGQTHKVELECRAQLRSAIAKIDNWGAKLGDDHTLPLPALAEIGGTALIGDGEIKMQENNLPSTFVPGAIFYSSLMGRRWLIGAGWACWSAACAKLIIPAILTASAIR